MKTILTALVGLVSAILSAPATEFQVSIGGNDGNAGTPAAPFRTIQHAADVARPGELVAIKDSERVTNWVHVRNDVWKVILPNSSFGSFNPYRDLIHGDWFSAKGRNHHTARSISMVSGWAKHRLEFRDFVPTFRGRVLTEVPLLNPAKANSVGFVISDKQAGPFGLEIAWIKASPEVLKP